MELWFYAIIIFVIVFLVSGISIPIYKKHKKVTGDIINYDVTMRKFVYKVNLSSEDIIRLLKIKNVADELSCSFDFDRSVINFIEYGANLEYYFQVQEYNEFSVLRLEQVALIGMQSYTPFKLNSFISGKLKAEIIPYSQYSF